MLEPVPTPVVRQRTRPRRPSVTLAPLETVQQPYLAGFSLSETGTFSKGGFSITGAGITASPLGVREASSMRYADLVVLRTIGAGSSSVVKVAQHAPTGKLLALKVLNMMGDEATREAAVNELRVLHSCASPHLVNFFDAFYQDGSVMIALQLARCSLADVFNALQSRAGVAKANLASVQVGLLASAGSLASVSSPVSNGSVSASSDSLPMGPRLRGPAGQAAENSSFSVPRLAARRRTWYSTLLSII